jgi:hypothetical protein
VAGRAAGSGRAGRPDVDAVDPAPGEAFDPAAFLRDSGTLFLLAAAVTSASCAPLVAAFVEDITETARTLAARAPGARLDPPLLLALDEIANLTASQSRQRREPVRKPIYAVEQLAELHDLGQHLGARQHGHGQPIPQSVTASAARAGRYEPNRQRMIFFSLSGSAA